MAITRESIWTAADQLDAEGDRPTLAAIRKKLGEGGRCQRAPSSRSDLF